MKLLIVLEIDSRYFMLLELLFLSDFSSLVKMMVRTIRKYNLPVEPGRSVALCR